VKGTKEKISVLFLFVILLGANVANLQLISSVVPKYNWREPPGQVVEKVSKSNTCELNYQILIEISEYVLNTAEKNNYQFNCVVYSTALLFESEEVLIIIGHGHFDSKQQYSIGDYSAEKIYTLAQEKNVIALLACYSASLKFDNKKQLTYLDKIDLFTVMNDLCKFLSWMQATTYTSIENIILFDFDSGDSNGNQEPTYLMNGLRYAYSIHPEYGHKIYWNLYVDSARDALYNYMLGYKYILVIFYFSGNFLIEQPSGNYELEYHCITYHAKIIIEGDMKNYLDLYNFEVDGAAKKRFAKKLKLDDINDIFESNYNGAFGIIERLDKFTDLFTAFACACLAAYVSFKVAALVSTVAAAAASLAKLATVFLWLTVALAVVAVLLAISALIIEIVAI